MSAPNPRYHTFLFTHPPTSSSPSPPGITLTNNSSPAFGAWLDNPPPHSVQPLTHSVQSLPHSVQSLPHSVQPVFSAIQRNYFEDYILKQHAILMQQQQQRDRELYQHHHQQYQQRQQQQQRHEQQEQPRPVKTPPSPHSPDQKQDYQTPQQSEFLADYVLTISVPYWPKMTMIYYPNGSIHVLCGGEPKGQFNTEKQPEPGQGFRYNVVANPLVKQVLRNNSSGDIQYSANGGFGVSFIEDTTRRGFSLGPQRGAMLGSTGGWAGRDMAAEGNIGTPELPSRMPASTVNRVPITRKLSKEESDCIFQHSDATLPASVPIHLRQTKKEYNAAQWLEIQRSSSLGGSGIGRNEAARLPVTGTLIDRQLSQPEWNVLCVPEEVPVSPKIDCNPLPLKTRHIEDKPSESSSSFNIMGAEEPPRDDVNAYAREPATSSSFEERAYEQESIGTRVVSTLLPLQYLHY